MTRLNHEKTNSLHPSSPVTRTDKSLQESDDYAQILDIEKKYWESKFTGPGPYKHNFVEKSFQRCSTDNREEFETIIKEQVKKQQEEARQETCPFQHFTGGKFKGFSYKDVWKSRPDYILWLYWEGKNPEFKKRLLQNIDLAEQSYLFFERWS